MIVTIYKCPNNMVAKVKIENEDGKHHLACLFPRPLPAFQAVVSGLGTRLPSCHHVFNSGTCHCQNEDGNMPTKPMTVYHHQ